MSQNLAPIHTWIFDQLGLVDGRADMLVDGLEAALGAPAREVWREILDRYPGRFAGRSIEEALDGAAIHQGLESMIATVQGREAELAAWARKSEAAWEAIRDAYAAHGASWGLSVRAAAAPKDAQALFAGLRELWLEGMPCDVRFEILEDGPDRVRWAVPRLVLPRYWEGRGCRDEDMIELHGAWMAAFTNAAAEDFTAMLRLSAVEDGLRCEFDITRR